MALKERGGLIWRDDPEPILFDAQLSPGEKDGATTVALSVGGRKYLLEAPSTMVDVKGSQIRALIIADYDGAYLVELPSETLFGSSRVLAKDGEFLRT